jgi:hypothetical protein
MLGSFAADKCAARLNAALRHAGNDRGYLFGDISSAGNVVQEEQRLRSAADNVVHAHRHAVDPDGIMLFQQERKLQLGPDTVRPRYQDRGADPRKIQRKQAAEAGRKLVAKLDFELEPMKNGMKPNRLAELICLAMTEATGADAAFSGTLSNYKVSPGTLNERELFLLAPYADTVEVRSLTPKQIRTILRELETKQKTADCMMYTGITVPDGIEGALVLGRTGKPIPENSRVRVAFNAYDAHGAGGRYPELKAIAESAAAPKSAPKPEVRDALRTYLLKHYPVPTKNDKRKP